MVCRARGSVVIGLDGASRSIARPQLWLLGVWVPRIGRLAKPQHWPGWNGPCWRSRSATRRCTSGAISVRTGSEMRFAPQIAVTTRCVFGCGQPGPQPRVLAESAIGATPGRCEDRRAGLDGVVVAVVVLEVRRGVRGVVS